MRLIAAALFVILLAGCGSSSGDAVLHFTGRDETESNFRERIRETKTTQPAAWVQVCGAIEGKSAAQAAALLIDEDGDPNQAVPGATPKPGQKADPTHLVRSAEIVQEECKR